ncbi:hypothetical protein PkP19E3_31385 (plasmid) [Pseudomonas koreensis]|nr:hypothetical protein PkP19E3_31385 [Pseudomonas koreensis]
MECNGNHLNNTLSIEPLMRPTSVAIIGVSTKPGTAGQVVLNNLVTGGYEGDIFLVGRSGGELDGRPILTAIEQLPPGVELAILVLPSAAVLDAVKSCVERRVSKQLSVLHRASPKWDPMDANYNSRLPMSLVSAN